MDIEHMRSEIAKQVNESLNDFLDTSIEDIGFKEEFYVGKVVNNNDPDRVGRCRIRVFGVFEADVPDNELPWAMPDFTFIGSKMGSFIVPPIDTIVRVYFDKGNINLPHYTVKVVDKNNLPSQKNTNYPNNMVMFETDEGDYLTINRQTKETIYHHNSDTEIKIDRMGNVTVKSTGNLIFNHTGQLKVQGLNAIPVPQGGPLCALPSCLYTGVPHSGNVAPTGPAVV